MSLAKMRFGPEKAKQREGERTERQRVAWPSSNGLLWAENKKNNNKKQQQQQSSVNCKTIWGMRDRYAYEILRLRGLRLWVLSRLRCSWSWRQFCNCLSSTTTTTATTTMTTNNDGGRRHRRRRCCIARIADNEKRRKLPRSQAAAAATCNLHTKICCF